MIIYGLYDCCGTGDYVYYLSKEKAKDALWEMYCQSDNYETDSEEVRNSARVEFEREDLITEIGHVKEVEVYE